MELRPIINKEKLLEQGNNKYIAVIMGVIGLIVGGFFAARFIIDIFR